MVISKSPLFLTETLRIFSRTSWFYFFLSKKRREKFYAGGVEAGSRCLSFNSGGVPRTSLCASTATAHSGVFTRSHKRLVNPHSRCRDEAGRCNFRSR